MTGMFGRLPEDFPPFVLPSATGLDTYVAMIADEEKICRTELPSNTFRKSIDSEGENRIFGTPLPA